MFGWQQWNAASFFGTQQSSPMFPSANAQGVGMMPGWQQPSMMPPPQQQQQQQHHYQTGLQGPWGQGMMVAAAGGGYGQFRTPPPPLPQQQYALQPPPLQQQQHAEPSQKLVITEVSESSKAVESEKLAAAANPEEKQRLDVLRQQAQQWQEQQTVWQKQYLMQQQFPFPPYGGGGQLVPSVMPPPPVPQQQQQQANRIAAANTAAPIPPQVEQKASETTTPKVSQAPLPVEATTSHSTNVLLPVPQVQQQQLSNEPKDFKRNAGNNDTHSTFQQNDNRSVVAKSPQQCVPNWRPPDDGDATSSHQEREERYNRRAMPDHDLEKEFLMFQRERHSMRSGTASVGSDEAVPFQQRREPRNRGGRGGSFRNRAFADRSQGPRGVRPNAIPSLMDQTPDLFLGQNFPRPQRPTSGRSFNEQQQRLDSARRLGSSSSDGADVFRNVPAPPRPGKESSDGSRVVVVQSDVADPSGGSSSDNMMEEFEKQLASWNEQFTKWKEQNKNHPDKSAFLHYERQFQELRQTLLERHAGMKRICEEQKKAKLSKPEAAAASDTGVRTVGTADDQGGSAKGKSTEDSWSAPEVAAKPPATTTTEVQSKLAAASPAAQKGSEVRKPDFQSAPEVPKGPAAAVNDDDTRGSADMQLADDDFVDNDESFPPANDSIDYSEDNFDSFVSFVGGGGDVPKKDAEPEVDVDEPDAKEKQEEKEEEKPAPSAAAASKDSEDRGPDADGNGPAATKEADEGKELETCAAEDSKSPPSSGMVHPGPWKPLPISILSDNKKQQEGDVDQKMDRFRRPDVQELYASFEELLASNSKKVPSMCPMGWSPVEGGGRGGRGAASSRRASATNRYSNSRGRGGGGRMSPEVTVQTEVEEVTFLDRDYIWENPYLNDDDEDQKGEGGEAEEVEYLDDTTVRDDFDDLVDNKALPLPVGDDVEERAPLLAPSAAAPPPTPLLPDPVYVDNVSKESLARPSLLGAMPTADNFGGLRTSGRDRFPRSSPKLSGGGGGSGGDPYVRKHSSDSLLGDPDSFFRFQRRRRGGGSQAVRSSSYEYNNDVPSRHQLDSGWGAGGHDWDSGRDFKAPAPLPPEEPNRLRRGDYGGGNDDDWERPALKNWVQKDNNNDDGGSLPPLAVAGTITRALTAKEEEIIKLAAEELKAMREKKQVYMLDKNLIVMTNDPVTPRNSAPLEEPPASVTAWDVPARDYDSRRSWTADGCYQSRSPPLARERFPLPSRQFDEDLRTRNVDAATGSGGNIISIDYGHGSMQATSTDRAFDYDDDDVRGPLLPPPPPVATTIDYGHGRNVSNLGGHDHDEPDWSYDCRRQERSRSRDEPRDGWQQHRGPEDQYPRRSPASRSSRSRTSGERNRSRDARPQQHFRDAKPPRSSEKACECVLIEDLLGSEGRKRRHHNIVIVLRGPPGSGKTYVAKLIKDKEMEKGGSAPRMLCLDDYFMVESEKLEVDVESGKSVKTKVLQYEYEPEMEESYRNSLFKSFRKTVEDGFFPFIVVDAVHDKVRHFEDIVGFARHRGFQVYVAEMDLDVLQCHKRNVHDRSLEDISKMVHNWEPTPRHYPRVDVRSLLQDAAITEVEMEDLIEESESQKQQSVKPVEPEVVHAALVVSKWEKMEATEEKLDKLDGLRSLKRRREPQSLEDYLQLPDDYDKREYRPGQKRVRWADVEERKDQEKKRAMGFVIGQTDWKKMTDPDHADKALNRTKYI